jgi:Uma2 family endonuclease
MTADELWAMPGDGFHHHELVKGELVTMSPSGANHSRVAGRIAVLLGSYILEHKLGEPYTADGGFYLARNPDTVLAPDFAVVLNDRAANSAKFFPGAPDIAVEVISPNDTRKEIRQKVEEYLSGGTRLVIIIDSINQTATIHTPTSTTRLTTDDTLTGGDVVPGWSLPLRELFS